MLHPTKLFLASCTVLLGGAAALAQDAAPAADPAAAPAATPAAKLLTLDKVEAMSDGVARLLEMQEDHGAVPWSGDLDQPAEWPYEGVYRVNRAIPIGYRVGGTSICGSALLAAPGQADDAPRTAALERARAFVVAAIVDPRMEFPYPPRYDVRGWGYAYGLDFLLRLKTEELIPAAEAEATEKAIQFYLDGIVTTELGRGGWNYAQRAGSDAPASFMTAPTLRALFHAKKHGYTVPGGLIERGLDSLDAARLPTNALVYSGRAGDRSRDTVAGATGRMLSAESTLALAGRGDMDRVRNALDRFFEHWDWLEKRRRQNGTHVPPHGIAPYYFFYAHHAAALAIEHLPFAERASYRAKLVDRLAYVREDDGSWNDRVFPRSANYGTAMTLLALNMSDAKHIHGWSGGQVDALDAADDDGEEGAVLGAGIGALAGQPIHADADDDNESDGPDRR
ncbi:MAG: hypothetical protein AB8G96_01430 [Phycisphaerales bacterium]